jgi:hypothetical protein
MRIPLNHAKSRGSVLLLTLLTAWVIGISLVSYLTLVANQNRTTYHSLAWNTCVPIMEAGVEEAMTQIHYNGITNLIANSWTFGLDGCYHKRRYIGAAGSYYEVSIQPVDPPVIISSGYSAAPANTGKPLGGTSAFGMILGAASGSILPGTPANVSRSVRVTTVQQTPSVAGLTAKGAIQFEGNAVLDSFNSSDSTASTDGKYDPAKARDKAMALTNSKQAGAINLGAAKIYGSATTGPGGSVATAGGAVGDAAWVASQTGVESGHFATDANVQLDDVPAPFALASGLTPIEGIVGGTNYGYVVDGTVQQNYNLQSTTINTAHPMIVTGNATLYIDGNLAVVEHGLIYLNAGASLKLYVSGSASIGGDGIVNTSGFAKNVAIYGLNTCASVNYSGTAPLIGTVYAPNAAFTFSGAAGGFGSFTANSISITDSAHVAFDESLKSAGEYVVASWNEL